MIDQRILAIVPAYNESGNIQRTIKEIKNLALPVDILVINDGSIDTTAAEAKAAGAKVLSLPLNLGIGGAVQTGFMFASKHHYDVAVQIDGTVMWQATNHQPNHNLIGIRFENTSSRVQELILEYAFEYKKEALSQFWFRGW